MTSCKEKKFFITLNFYAPHVPIQGKPELVKKYGIKRANVGYQGLPEDEYAAMVENIDYNVGRVIDHVKSLQLENKTLILFTSDNGGLDVQEVPAFAKFTPPTQNTPLRAGKGYLYEGGIRTPWIIWSPSHIIKARKINDIVSTDDIFNTCMELANVNEKSLDGKSIMPSIRGMKQNHRDFYLHFPHYSPQRGNPGAVVRSGNFKLIHWYENDKIELFDLSSDQSESLDISKSNPKKVKELKLKLDNWKKALNAQMTTPNPIYNGNK
jgi:arylsulfatase A-like enzyme